MTCRIARGRETPPDQIAREIVEEALAECAGDDEAIVLLACIFGALAAELELRIGREDCASLIARHIVSMMEGADPRPQ